MKSDKALWGSISILVGAVAVLFYTKLYKAGYFILPCPDLVILELSFLQDIAFRHSEYLYIVFIDLTATIYSVILTL